MIWKWKRCCTPGSPSEAGGWAKGESPGSSCNWGLSWNLCLKTSGGRTMTSLERSSCKELILSLGCVPFSRVICSLGIWLRLPELMGFPVLLRVSLIAQSVKNLAAIWGTWVQSLGWDDPPGGGHGNPLQYSCLENPHGQRSLAGCGPWRHSQTRLSS